MIYNLLRSIIINILRFIFLFDKRKKDFLKNRLYQNMNDLQNCPYIWIHSASVGEINLSETLVRELLKSRKERLLLTCLTDTGMATLKSKYANTENVDILFFPLDDKKELKKIIEKIQLKILILIETEIWPNLIQSASQARIVMVNGRLSERSFGRYCKIKAVIKKILDKIDDFYMQSQGDADKIIKLGADPSKVEVLGNLKFDIKLNNFSHDEIKEYKDIILAKDRKILLAGSTRTGENEIILDVFSQLKDIYLIIAPRHPERVPDIEKLITEKNITYNKFTELKNKSKIIDNAKILIIDAIGQLRKLYAVCDYAFVGGTLVNIGGHSLLEPLFYHKTPIFGPYLQNVKDISKEILNRKIGYLVHDKNEFIQVIKTIDSEKNTNSEVDKNKSIDEFFSNNSNVAEKIVERLNDKQLWKHFFSTPKKNYNKYMYMLLDYPEYIIYDKLIMNALKSKWKERFRNSNDISLEIGSGSGNFISELALREKNTNFICLEIRFKRLVLSAKKIKRNNLSNVIFLRRIAEDLKSFLGKDEIKDVYINFPDPWEENESNRVLQDKFLDMLNDIQKKSGIIYFKTDHDKYYRDILSMIGKRDDYKIIYNTDDLHHSDKNINNIKTEFEKLFLYKHNKNINYIEMQKIK